MPRGGARIGAGRPPGPQNRGLWGPLAEVGSEKAFAFLTAAIEDPSLPFADRMRCAVALLPFERPRAPPIGLKQAALAKALSLPADSPFAPGPPPAYVGKKEQVQRDAVTAAKGTAWEQILAPQRPPWRDWEDEDDE